MNDLLEEGISIISSSQDIIGFGELLNEAWQTKRSLSTIVSNPKIDEIYDQANAAGAIGGKLTGAGGGGFLLLFAPPSRQRKIQEKLSKLIHVPFNFESSGSQIIFFDLQEDYSEIEKARTNQQVLPFQELKHGQPK